MVDQVTITIKAGNGGSGIASFLREKYRPKGGPDGGNGGRGGDVFLVADANVATLRDFTSRQFFAADDGGRGGSNTKAGRSGEDLYVKVPVGTLVYEAPEAPTVPAGKTLRVGGPKPEGLKEAGVSSPSAKASEDLRPAGVGVLLFDLTNHDQTVLVASGGAGGRGNHALRGPANRLPREAETGLPGEKRQLFLELKLLADVGIIGLPNAGKTTLLNALTRARGEVGSYPFTTLEPNLGVMAPLILADIPGLIEGASAGRGLGDQFLKHIERTRILVHLLDGGKTPAGKTLRVGGSKPEGLKEAGVKEAEVLWQDYQTINQELKNFHPALAEKEQIVVLNKLDLTEVGEAYPKVREFFGSQGVELLAVSAATGEGLEELKKEIFRRAKSAEDRSPALGTEPGVAGLPAMGRIASKLATSRGEENSKGEGKTYRLRDLPNRRIVFSRPPTEEDPRWKNPRRRYPKG